MPPYSLRFKLLMIAVNEFRKKISIFSDKLDHMFYNFAHKTILILGETFLVAIKIIEVLLEDV